MYKTDRGKFHIIETGEGFLRARISIAKPGVFPYVKSDGRIAQEAKLPEDLFLPSVIDSMRGVPVTDGHPDVLLSSDNYKEYVKGTISDPEIQDGLLVGIATIYDQELIQKIKAKKQNEVSIGYNYIADGIPGELKGESYESADKNIMINHVALEPKGRAGEEIKIHLDRRHNMSIKWKVDGDSSSDSLTYRKNDGSTDIQVAPDIHKELMAIKNDSKEKTITIEKLKSAKEKLKESIEEMKNDSAAAEDQKELKEKLEIANDKAASWEKKLDEANKSLPDLISKGVTRKFELVEFSKSVSPDLKVDGLTNDEIKLQIIAKGLPFREGVKLDSLTSEIIEARYDAACDLLRAKATEIKKNIPAGIKIDSNEIEKKRAALMTVYQRAREGK